MKDNELTRRETLKKGTVASGGLVLGMSATSTAGAKQKPGSAFVPLGSPIQAGDTFTIDNGTGDSVNLSPSCKAGPPSKDYQVFEVSGTLAANLIAVNPNRGVEAGSTVYEVTSVKDDCELAFDNGTKFAYKPA